MNPYVYCKHGLSSCSRCDEDKHPSKHKEHAKKVGVSTPCTAHHITFGGKCLNCGYIEKEGGK